MLRRAVIGMLLRKVHHLRAVFQEEADTFNDNNALIVHAVEAVVVIKPLTDEHVTVPPGTAAWNEDRLRSKRDTLELLPEPSRDLGLEIRQAIVRCARLGPGECLVLIIRKQAHYHINVAVAIDVCIVRVRALEERLEALQVVGRAAVIKHVLDARVCVARLRDRALLRPCIKL